MVVREACKAGIGVLAVPGPSAALAALSVSGLSPARFLSTAFCRRKREKKRKTLRELLSGPFPVVFFESPRRIAETLAAVKEEAPGRRVVVCRELTKLHEEIMRGRVEEVLEEATADETRGEYTIIVEGKGRQTASATVSPGRRRYISSLTGRDAFGLNAETFEKRAFRPAAASAKSGPKKSLTTKFPPLARPMSAILRTAS